LVILKFLAAKGNLILPLKFLLIFKYHRINYNNPKKLPIAFIKKKAGIFLLHTRLFKILKQ
jgi:hypothetical protein